MSLTEYANLEQGTPEWLEARRGLITASVVGQLISVGTPDPLAVTCPACLSVTGEECISLASKTRKSIKVPHPSRSVDASDRPPTYAPATGDTANALVANLAAERITGTVEDSYMNRDMERGWMEEPRARERYAETRGVEVREVGLYVRAEDDWTLGYSPDGLIGDDGLLEIKAPRAKGHVLTVVNGEVPAHNMAQIQAGFLVTGRKWLDFIPWRGGQPMWVKRVYPDPAWQTAIVAACQKFETAIAEMVTAYEIATNGLPATERMPDLYAMELN